MITLNDYFTSSGKYRDRLNSPEITDETRMNAQRLLSVVNPMLEELGITEATVSSGFRPSSVNKNIPGSAKKSLHMIGLAIDLSDPDGKIDALIEAHPELLDKYGLWQERSEFTEGWAHLDLGNRSPRAIRVFIP